MQLPGYASPKAKQPLVMHVSAKNQIVGGDANAKSLWWGSPTTDNRGNKVAGMIVELNLHILNIGTTPTFDTIKGGQRYHSYVDITACSTDILDKVTRWSIDGGLTSSDHSGMLFDLNLVKSKGVKIERTTRKYKKKKTDWSELHMKLNQLNQENK